MPLPERLKHSREEAMRVTTEDVACFQGAEASLDSKFGTEDWLLRGLYLDYRAITRRNLKRQEVEDELARAIKRCSAVQKVWTRTELEAATDREDPYFELYKNNYHPERSPDLFVQRKPFHLIRQRDGTTHGTPYPYDTHMPLVVVFPGISPALVSQRVHTVDLAPTLASLLGVQTPEDLDGIDRTYLFK
jgi:hypothetical protein